ncbi:apiosidase-like domain-containing protein [Catalinimonas niigatensis]|uniref:apiosidase-like domain-containing protein n=1 Tax=Catalinimonas niigatensis TaxID=1397264 RepID=UPI002666474F|nr:DUF4038 domain-containing protein [Catalinimonas niigatensis]WPP47944.1 DUF4038 domain-containing protein [Catalinimonas niigatensis]
MLASTTHTQGQAHQWMKYELTFGSDSLYDNPLYEIDSFYTVFTSPSGKAHKIYGFWDGDRDWKVRFMPNEIGDWQYKTFCSDEKNSGLHAKEGSFRSEKNSSELPIFQKGNIIHLKGDYHLSYADGSPFFWLACTAWNGTLKSTEKEWDDYLAHRKDHHYSVIQFVATQWRGAEVNSQLQKAFSGQGKIKINPAFFQHLDHKVDKINTHGLVAAPVLLWALPKGEGRELSPGYALPQEEAIKLARYMVARYGAHHVVWTLGGDGWYTHLYEQRWKNIGRAVFGEAHPGVVAQHPMGRSWIGEAYAEEGWLDIVGYQSSHGIDSGNINWINKGPMKKKWDKLPARPLINMEPCYEEIYFRNTDTHVRNASYWSLFATPVAGITYGANGIWPWIRKGEKILNHGSLSEKSPSTWRESIDFPGSHQMGYLAKFIQQFAWWELKPDHDLLAKQPGDEQFDHYISLLRTDDYSTMLTYVPFRTEVQIINAQNIHYKGQWYNPVKDSYSDAEVKNQTNKLSVTPPGEGDWVLVLKKTE